MNTDKTADSLIADLRERAKELSCLYEVEELTNKSDMSLEDVFNGVVGLIPPGWQYSDKCQAKITYGRTAYVSPDFQETPWLQSADILVQDEVVGKIEVYYTEEMPKEDEGPFLKEERKLLNTIAERLSNFLMHRRLQEVFQRWQTTEQRQDEWRIILNMLRQTDPQLLVRVSRKMTNYLCWSGSNEAEKLLEHFSPIYKIEGSELTEDLNRPNQKKEPHDFLSISEEVFRIANDYLGEREALANVQRWIKEDKSAFLVNLLENEGSSHTEIAEGLERFHHLDSESSELSEPRRIGFRVSLIRRLLTGQPEFINIAKHFIGVNDFFNLLHRTIFPAGSHGKLGGKSSGLFLAHQILKKSSEHGELFGDIKVPKTWYITSDGILHFMHYNNLEEVVEQKYKDTGQVRQEYPSVVHVFKNSTFPPELIQGLSMALDDFGNRPLIVRSSSLLEDRLGTAFAGKYKSLFIANQGSKQERLLALMDAIAEVYASTFGPDPIQYRAERGLLDFHEEMGIMIQEVVGKKIGHFFLPAFAGVAFSNNEFRWSPRIKPEDGLVRLVPGLGTRAVDRLSDDYPSLIAPGQPGLRVNVTIDEAVRYSPKKIDVINLKSNAFETVELRELLREFGDEFPQTHEILSILGPDRITMPMAMHIDFKEDELVVSFEGLRTRTPFVKQMHAILKTLEEKLDTPVDIEFASDGQDFYLLQCRPQSYGPESSPADIPADVPMDRVVFSADRYISNGAIGNLTHIVYVDPQKYSELSSRSDLVSVSRTVSKLNKILPKRQFILMGPGRWGSRGDIKLGVSVTYSDISNTAVLIEIARQRGNYMPELSFGTHFFQDLIEASIRYLPLYPDESGVIFNEEFLTSAGNILPDLLPDVTHLSDTVRVIDVSKSTDGLVLQVLMNGELNKAIGMLAEPRTVVEEKAKKREYIRLKGKDEHWQWRLRMAEELASHIEPKRFGVKALYVFGSTKNAAAGPESDVDLLIHFKGTEKQKRELLLWLEGWSLCLGEMNFLRTGTKSGGLLDVHIVTDEDIRKRTSYAVKINAVTDAARELPLKKM